MNIADLIVSSGIAVALLTLVAGGVKYLGAYLSSKADILNAQIKDQNLKNAANTAENALYTAVSETLQTTVTDLKDKSADGKLTAPEMEQIKSDTLAKAKQIIGDKVLASLGEIYGDVDAYLSSRLESFVLDLKQRFRLGSSANAPATSSPVAKVSSDSPAAPSDSGNNATPTTDPSTPVETPVTDSAPVQSAETIPTETAPTVQTGSTQN